MMEVTPKELFGLRDCLFDYFSERAVKVGIQLNPTERAEKDIVLSERLYEEQKGKRIFVVVVGDPKIPAHLHLDAFTKRTGLEFELSLLYVTSTLAESHFEKLWRAYLMWLHEGASEEEALSVLIP
jgi:hypothetical protein